MTELTQPIHRERISTAGGLGSLFDDNPEAGGLVTVAVGPYVERLPLGNSTVAQIRGRFGLRFDIDPRTQAVLDGHEVGDDTVVRTGQVLMFVHKSGEKGCRKVQGPRSEVQGWIDAPSTESREDSWMATDNGAWIARASAFGDAGCAYGTFPLTPALSPGERGNAPPPQPVVVRVGFHGARTSRLPLPKGEGWGEGEGRALFRRAFKNGFRPAWKRELAWSFLGPRISDLGPSRPGTPHG